MTIQSRVLRTIAIAAAALVAAGTAVAEDITIDLGRGPVNVHIPDSYDPNVPMPLVMLLHGYGSNSADQEGYMQFQPVSDEVGYIFLAPDGRRDILGLQYWNATNACCDYFGNSNDSGYLRDLISEVQGLYNVDTQRIYIVGHSNGGFMAYRMACDHSDTIAAIASLAGATWLDPDDCSPDQPVHVLQMHGTADDTILYPGGCIFGFFGCYPGAVDSLLQWSGFNGCVGSPTRGPDIDLDVGLSGDETLTADLDNCSPGGSVHLWAIPEGSHIPDLPDDFSRQVVDYFLAHPKAP